MRTTFSTPVTPTRVRLRCVVGRRAWTSSRTDVRGALTSLTIPSRKKLLARLTRLYIETRWGVCGFCRVHYEEGLLAAKEEGALLVQPEVDDAMPFGDVEKLRSLIAEARERGYVTPDE